MDNRHQNHRNDQDYFLEDDQHLYYQNIQAITGSQIIRAYGVPPIQEAPSNEEITLRHIDSHLSNFARGDNRHFSQGFGNMSNILTPKLKNNTVNELNSLHIGQNKKESMGSANNLQTSLQILVQQQQNSQQYIPQNKASSQQGFDYNRQGSNFSHNQNEKVLSTNEDLNDLRLQESSRQKQGSPKYQQQSQFQTANNYQDKIGQQQLITIENQQPMQGSLKEPLPNAQQQQINNLQVIKDIGRQGSKSETLFSNKSVKMQCPFCSKNIQTQVNYTPSCKTHLLSVGLGIIGFICGLCLVPYYFEDKFQTAIHSCPQCKKEIGRCEY